MTRNVIAVKQVSKIYPLGKTEVKALDDISLTIEEGAFVSIAGPSGCGKSTLLNLIGCMDLPTSGSIEVDQQAIEHLSDQALTKLRLEKLGFIFQSFNLIPVLSVFQNVEFPLLIQGGHSEAQRKERVQALLEEVGLSAQRNQRSAELSGGQRQRVAIARSLVTNPKIVLADEPTANLDSTTGERIIDLMKKMNQTSRTTLIFSTHDPQVMRHAHRMIRLKDGRLAQE